MDLEAIMNAPPVICDQLVGAIDVGHDKDFLDCFQEVADLDLIIHEVRDSNNTTGIKLIYSTEDCLHEAKALFNICQRA